MLMTLKFENKVIVLNQMVSSGTLRYFNDEIFRKLFYYF